MLYLQHFGLREPPFRITPDTAFFYPGTSPQQALNTLLVALSAGEGFIKVVGEVGTGKTLLCRKLLAGLGPNWVCAYIPNPDLPPRSLLLTLADEFGVKPGTDLDDHRLTREINRALLQLAREGKRALVCLDEAQAMSVESLETLRLLTNLETEKRKLLQVVLFGQPELDEKLAQDRIRQLRQRITFQHQLTLFDKNDLQHYLEHRLTVAGRLGGPVFSPAAVNLLHRASGGTPRLVNILANKAMMLAFGEGAQRVSRSHMKAAILDTPASVAKSAPVSLQVLFWLAALSGLAYAVFMIQRIGT
jgi:MSHA biogenesis protein MshM